MIYLFRPNVLSETTKPVPGACRCNVDPRKAAAIAVHRALPSGNPRRRRDPAEQPPARRAQSLRGGDFQSGFRRPHSALRGEGRKRVCRALRCAPTDGQPIAKLQLIFAATARMTLRSSSVTQTDVRAAVSLPSVPGGRRRRRPFFAAAAEGGMRCRLRYPCACPRALQHVDRSIRPAYGCRPTKRRENRSWELSMFHVGPGVSAPFAIVERRCRRA